MNAAPPLELKLNIGQGTEAGQGLIALLCKSPVHVMDVASHISGHVGQVGWFFWKCFYLQLTMTIPSPIARPAAGYLCISMSKGLGKHTAPTLRKPARTTQLLLALVAATTFWPGEG